MVRFACPVCSAPHEVPDDTAGKKINCQTCGQRVLVPSPTQNKTVLAKLLPEESSGDRADASRLKEVPRVARSSGPKPELIPIGACASCQTPLRVPRESLGRWVECPKCGTGFTAMEENSDVPEAIPVEPSGKKRDDQKFCHECGAKIRAKAVVCPRCGVAQPGAYSTPDLGEAGPETNRVAAGVLAILLGALGIHKFILGFTTAGIIMLLVTVLSCGWGGLVMGVIGIVEGILYLSKSDREFYKLYVVQKKAWF
jgi:TM2 domain-containing membrane protein YozV/DNA-directed RNA polymerase subunit RPC12/RpoP